jgi:transposase, ISSpnII
MYQDEADFRRISKMSSCWAPQGIQSSIPSLYMREYRYCYGVVDAQTGDSFLLIAGGCNTEWTNEFLRHVSQACPDDYILLVMDNAIWNGIQPLV